MKIIANVRHMRENASRLRDQGDRIGFVPTMGYLHEGHLSLLRRARDENHALVVSVFVNPTQFGPREDFASYPRDLERDAHLCREAGTDILFAPSAEEMYPPPFLTTVRVSGLTEGLCGASRPGHFEGVATVVSKLFAIVRPHRAYFGLKDYQQFRVISQMASDLSMDVEVVGLPTVREGDGLAMSSRNVRLSPEERRAALCLSEAIALARRLFDGGERRAEALLVAARGAVSAQPLARADYVELVDPVSLAPLETAGDRALLALAVFVGQTRLIDNAVLGEPAPHPTGGSRP